MNLIDLARTVPVGSWLLASKECDRSEETWELQLTSPNLVILRDVSYSLAHARKGHGGRLRYVIVSGQVGEVIYGPFCSIYDPDVRSTRIVDRF